MYNRQARVEAGKQLRQGRTRKNTAGGVMAGAVHEALAINHGCLAIKGKTTSWREFLPLG